MSAIPFSRPCSVTGELLPEDQLIRFVIGPDHTIFPDLGNVLPGEGIWVKATYVAVEKAVAAQIFQQYSENMVQVDSSLPVKVEGLLKKSCLQQLGIVNKSGNLVAGFYKVKEGLTAKHKKVAVLVSASDGAEDGKNKVRLSAGGIKEISVFSSRELAAILGRDHVVHIALMESGATGCFVKAVEKFINYQKDK